MIGSKVNFAGALCFGMKQSQEIMLNQATLVVFVLGPRVRKHDECVLNFY